MTAKQLIEILQTYPPDTRVCVNAENEYTDNGIVVVSECAERNAIDLSLDESNLLLYEKGKESIIFIR